MFDRWTPVWHVFFYAVVAIATGRALTRPGVTREAQGVVLALAGALVAWHLVLLVRPGRGHRERPRQVAGYLGGATALSVGLVSRDPVFFMVAMTLYNHVFAFLPMRWAVPAAIGLTAVLGIVGLRGNFGNSTLLVLVGAGVALVVALYLSATGNESEKRAELIDALERTRGELARAERQAGQAEERQRIARELHDTVTQQLLGIVLHLEGASKDEATEAAVRPVLDLAREGLADARRLVWMDRPRQLETETLSKALATLCERAEREAELTIERDVAAEVDALAVPFQTLVLRATQEALANVRKHARARRVAVSAAIAGNLLVLDVQDDGVGFVASATEAVDGSGFGLRGLRERVESLGGTVAIESHPNEGTTIAVHVPLGDGGLG